MADKKSNSSKKNSGKSSSKAKKAEEAKKKRLIIIAACVVVILIVIAVVIYFVVKPEVLHDIVDEYKSYVSAYFNDSSEDDKEDFVAHKSTPVPEGNIADISTADFSIHFLELGNKYAGDCTLIKCGDTEVLIDAGSRTSSAEAISSYVDQYCTDGKLEYVIATHAHQDHIAGFVGKNVGNTKTGILYKYKVGTIIQFSMHNSTAAVYNNYVAAVENAKSRGTTVYDAKQCWYETDGAKKSYDLSVAQDNSLTLNVLYNYYYENTTEDENDYSVCVLLSYNNGVGTMSHYLFTGDLEGNGEDRLVDNNTLPEVELFKGAHHGSKTSSTEKLLNVIKPKNVAVCCCAGSTEYTKNNDNTFPTQAFVDRISKYTANVYCTSLCIDYDKNEFTSMNGNIVFYMKDNSLSSWFSNNGTPLKDTQWFKDNRKCPQAWK